jgi:hypothetical protein
LYVLSVGSPAHTSRVSLTTREFTQGRSPIHAETVGKLLETSHASIDIGELTQERDPMFALIVGKLSPTCHALSIIRECCMQERNVLIQSSWKILSQKSHSLSHVGDLIQEKHPANMVSVQMPL